jgi:hypothetical protein
LDIFIISAAHVIAFPQAEENLEGLEDILAFLAESCIEIVASGEEEEREAGVSQVVPQE